MFLLYQIAKVTRIFLPLNFPQVIELLHPLIFSFLLYNETYVKNSLPIIDFTLWIKTFLILKSHKNFSERDILEFHLLYPRTHATFNICYLFKSLFFKNFSSFCTSHTTLADDNYFFVFIQSVGTSC